MHAGAHSNVDATLSLSRQTMHRDYINVCVCVCIYTGGAGCGAAAQHVSHVCAGADARESLYVDADCLSGPQFSCETHVALQS